MTTRLIGGIAPLRGSLPLLFADATAACAWRGFEGERERAAVESFQSACRAGGPCFAHVAVDESGAPGILAQLGAMARDATVFRTDDRVVIVGPYWERGDGRDVDAAMASEVRRLVEETPPSSEATLVVESGRLVVAHAWGDLSDVDIPPVLAAAGSAILRDDTGDLVLAVTRGAHALAVRRTPLGGDRVDVLYLTPS